METWHDLFDLDPDMEKFLKERKLNQQKNKREVPYVVSKWLLYSIKIPLYNSIAYSLVLIMFLMDISLMMLFFDIVKYGGAWSGPFFILSIITFFWLCIIIPMSMYVISVFLSKELKNIYWLLFSILLVVIWITPVLILFWDIS